MARSPRQHKDFTSTAIVPNFEAMGAGLPQPSPFHLSCPYTSLPVCRCRLYTRAPPSHARNPMKIPRPRNENPLRRALLLEILYSTSAPPRLPQAPSPALTYALHTRAAYGRLSLPSTTETALAAVARAADIADEEALVKMKRRELEAHQRVTAAREELERLENREKDSEAAIRVRHDRLAESSDDDSEPERVRRRGRPRKRR